MIKEPNNKYESPKVKFLELDGCDIVTTSGNNFIKWDWVDDTSNDDGWSS